MLAVDISFLAIPGVISAAAVVIYLSAMCSVSSLVASMLLAVENRGWGTDTAEGAVRCLFHAEPGVMLICPSRHRSWLEWFTHNRMLKRSRSCTAFRMHI